MSTSRHWRPAAWVPLLAVIAVVAVFVPGASAVHNLGLFELDGNAVEQAAPGDDWDTIRNNASTTAQTTQFITDLYDSNADTIFTGGSSKDDLDISGWKCKAGGAVDKNDIEHAFAASYVKDGQTYVYFGADRFSNDGDSQIGFWFLQAAAGCSGSGNFTGAHAIGDILVLSDFTNGGTISTIRVFKWVGSGGDTNGTLQLIGTGADCTNVPSADTVCARVNAGDEPAPWPYTPKPNIGSPGIFPHGALYEGGMNLSALLATQNLPCVSTFLAETRQSQSVDSTLEDFAAGTVNSCPNVTIQKTPDSGSVLVGDSFDWQLLATNNGAAASNVVVTDTIPAGLTINSATYDVDPNSAGGTGNCSVAGQLVTCAIASLGGSDGNTTGADPAVACATVNNTGAVTADREPQDAKGDNSDSGSISVCRPVPEARISITPASATNEVRDPHTFTVKVEADPDVNSGAGFAPVAGAHVDFSLTNGSGANAVVDAAASTCDNAGSNTDAGGECVIVFTSATAGTVTGNASVTVLGLSRSTSGNSGPGGSGPAVKTYVDANIQIGPQSATNPIGTNHTLTGHVNVNSGSGFANAPAGTQIAFSIVSGPGSFVGGTNTCTTVGTTGSCTVEITSAGAGTTIVKAATDASVGGLTLHRETGDGLAGDSGNASKTWEGARITISPSATNEIGDPHTFTVTVSRNAGSGYVPASGEHVDFTLTSSNGAASVLNAAASTCDNAGPNTNAAGQCTIVFTSNSPGKVTGHASATLAIDGHSVTIQTDGSGDNSSDAVKTFVDANIQISPQSATNPIGTNHTLTGHVNVNSGSGFANAPAGTQIAFSIVSG